ncbi:hypothetical protein GCM10010478_05000 [Streptomyces erythrogriseus]|uniref:Uncharacterized protein n=1 Tax=Streptomyces erythrogriseus TaxID=284027 RepID=A0ABN3WDD7_9ACTN
MVASPGRQGSRVWSPPSGFQTLVKELDVSGPDGHGPVGEAGARRTPCPGGPDEVESAVARHVGRVRGPGGDDIV